jgi:putative tryptophan/tyrosine transport system substrate-binding protein
MSMLLSRHTRRREVIAALAAAAAASGARAHAPRRARLGWFSGRAAGALERSMAVFRQTLDEQGWRIGETLDVIERLAEGDAASLPGLAAEIVARRPEVIACSGGTEAKVLQAATRSIPIVFMQVLVDPVEAGLVSSITRPGGKITGITQSPRPLTGKRLDILAELLRRPPRRLAYLVNPGNTGVAAVLADAAEAAVRTGAEILRADVAAPGELDRSLERVQDREAVLVAHDFMFVALRKRIAELAVRYGLPVMYETEGHVAAGGLVSYGADLRENYRQGALYVDQILKGASPGDLPVIQASRFELVLNTDAAKAINLTIPPTLLARAD